MSATDGPRPIAIGTSIAHYQLLGHLGSGGMGDVYRAHDSKLNRDVAVKVLRGPWTSDEDRLVRFRREAQLLAALNHHNIGQIYGLEDFDGTCALIMELVDGPTLADRLLGGPFPVREALQVGIRIAEALETAHHQGIVHRDLKPSNIKLRDDGVVKVLDFGLAKLVEPPSSPAGSVSMSPTISLPATVAGVILGTAAYMAPEQARGRAVDRRADIWSFGCVLYELLTGRRVFGGDDIGETLALVITKEPDWSVLPGEVPAAIRKVLRRCLEKEPNRRFADIADVRLDIEEALIAPADPPITAASPATRNHARRRLVAMAVVASVLVGALSFWIGRRGAAERPAAPVARFLLNVAPADRLQATPTDREGTEGRPSRTSMAWLPDGRAVILSAAEGDRQQLYVRSIDRLEATALPGTEGGAMPFTSPDGRWVGFWSSGALKKIPVDGGGPASTICETTLPFGAAWGVDDTIIFSRASDGLWRVPAAGGTAQLLLRPDTAKGELKYLAPQFLRGGAAVAFTVTHTPFPTWEDDTEIVAHVLATGERKILVRGGADGRYVPSGHLVYLRKSTLMAVPFDEQTLETHGGAVALIAGVMQSVNTPNELFEGGDGQFGVSSAGSLIYAPGGIFPDPERSLAWVDRTGAVEPLPLAARAYLSPRLSPDGRRFLVWTQGDRNVWVHDLMRGVTTRVTSEGRNARAIWTPDGSRITYGSATAGAENIFWRPADGSGTADRLASSQLPQAPGTWTPDGKTLLFMENSPTTQYDIWTLSPQGDGARHPLVQTAAREEYPDLSPDGHWLAYVSNQSGRFEVYVQPYPGTGPRQQVSVNGGTAPAWSRDGRELFYTTAASFGGQAALTQMMAVPVQLKPTFTAGTPRMLFQGRYGATANIRSYDVSPDGRRFLMVQQKDRAAVRLSEMIVVQNWVEELKEKVRP